MSAKTASELVQDLVGVDLAIAYSAKGALIVMGADALPALIATLDDPSVRRVGKSRCVNVLDALGPTAAPAVKTIVGLLDQALNWDAELDNPQVFNFVLSLIGALGSIRVNATTSLVRLATDELLDEGIRDHAAMVLLRERTGNDLETVAVPMLIKLLEHKNNPKSVLKLLVGIGKRCLPALEVAAKTHQNSKMRELYSRLWINIEFYDNNANLDDLF